MLEDDTLVITGRTCMQGLSLGSNPSLGSLTVDTKFGTAMFTNDQPIVHKLTFIVLYRATVLPSEMRLFQFNRNAAGRC